MTHVLGVLLVCTPLLLWLLAMLLAKTVLLALTLPAPPQVCALHVWLALFLLLWVLLQQLPVLAVQQGATLPLAHLHALPVVPAGTQLRLACHRSTTV